MTVFGRSKWSTGLCSSCGDLGPCCITCFVPCITFGRIAEMVDEKSSCVTQGIVYGLLMLVQCHCLYSCTYRNKLRSKYDLPAEPCHDCCVHWCCDSCALCQEHAELKSRGMDPAKGFITCCLPCVTFGQIAEMLDEGQSSCASHAVMYGLLMLCQCHCLYGAVYREKLRMKFSLPAEPCGDCCVHWCCGNCALCQEHAELTFRGLDPSKGWIGPPSVPAPFPPSAPMPPSMNR
ncbi:hypothetical protein IFM89_007555 [Coptis chinensis]|uniref:Uncharacterized protein n=1 Tax=Coptis chinensis TaxID=261450 RepID=A0A835LYU7_9MAGN|nr:hypothetical protein IFM89_007555 [Coptis chinensis]